MGRKLLKCIMDFHECKDLCRDALPLYSRLSVKGAWLCSLSSPVQRHKLCASEGGEAFVPVGANKEIIKKFIPDRSSEGHVTFGPLEKVMALKTFTVCGKKAWWLFLSVTLKKDSGK